MKMKNMTTLHLKESICRSPLRRGVLLIPFALCCFGLLPAVQAVTPAPDGGYPNGNTAEGQNALFSLTTGHSNTANGLNALHNNTTGNNNTANGVNALFSNIFGHANTATGSYALYRNTTGYENTANGYGALQSNTTGNHNTATGLTALYNNTTGTDNTATGVSALGFNTTGGSNTANGSGALAYNTTGHANTANGYQALFSNMTGYSNTANGVFALFSNTSGLSNIAVGFQAGYNLTIGSHNIDIGNGGVAGESNKIRIGMEGTQNGTFIAGIANATVTGSGVYINTTTGQLGLLSSSERFKDAIETMGNASEALLSLRPVTFRYKKDVDPKGSPQFGLVAEEVEKVNPDLVVKDTEGKVFTVRYEAVNAMLLNEFLKAHCKMEEQGAMIALQQKEIAALTASLKAQASQIQKVSAQLELSKPVSQMAGNNQ
jgi:Chaperone of endosialidase